MAIDQGDQDFVMGMAQVKTIQQIFERKNKELEESKDEHRFEITVVEGAKHGFAARCDMDNEAEAAQEQIAEDHAVEWFKRWFMKGKTSA